MSILYYFIDEETRKLRPEAAHKVVAQKDHNSDVIRVGIPETMDSVDLETSAVRCMYQRPKETEVRSKTATYYDTSGGYLWYDWTLQEGDTAKAGKINFSVCLQHIEGGLLTVDWNTTIGEIFVKTSYHSDDSDEGDETITPTVVQRVAVLETIIQRVASGAPVVVGSVSDMTDTAQIYVLSTDGMWYYHNGSAWVAGGTYGALSTDTTLTQSGVPADAKKTGDAFASLNGSLGTYAVGKNLVGAENGKLYPVYLPQSGMKLTVSSISDDPSASAYLNLFNADGVYITYYNIEKDYLPRTLTINHSGELYMCITNSSRAAQINSAIYQVEFGSNATEYEEYFSNAKSLSKKVESLVTNKFRGIVFEQGSIRAGNDEYSYTSIQNRVRSNRFRLTQPIKITPKDGYKVYYTQITEGTPVSPGWRTAPYVLNNAECEYRICVGAIDDSDVGFGNIQDYIEIEIINVPLHGKNLVGQESGVLYPVDIVKNQAYTMSTKNGAPVEGYIQLNFYSETKERINYAVFTKGLSERTLTWSDNTPVKYVMLLTDEGEMGTQIQLEYGNTKTSFADYVNLDAEKNKNIKDYYHDEMVHSMATVKSLITEPALVFPIITDIHFMSSSNGNPLLILDSANNIEHFLKKIRCDFVLNLGDNTDGDNAVNGVTKARNAVVVDKLAGMGIPYYQALGNHDTNYYSGTTLTMAEIFSSYFSSTKKDNMIFNPNANGTEYYVDYPGVGVRVVVLDTNYGTRYTYSATTGAWLESDALQTEYIVLLCEHLSSIRTQNWASQALGNAASVNTALQAFVDGGGTLIQLCGHSHCDYAFESPWLSVFSNCNKAQKVNLDTDEYRAITGYSEALYAPDRVVGTVSEDCWSIGILRPTARKLNLIRFGAGEDREYTF